MKRELTYLLITISLFLTLTSQTLTTLGRTETIKWTTNNLADALTSLLDGQNPRMVNTTVTKQNKINLN